MTAEDRLRGRLRSAASSLPVDPGSISNVRLRAARLHRRRSAVRASVGAFALVAVAAIGVVSVRDGAIDDYSTTAADSPDAEATAATVAVAAAQSADDGYASAEPAMAGDDMADEAMAGEADAEPAAEDDSGYGQTAGDLQIRESARTESSDTEIGVFAATVSMVTPPPAVEGAVMRYSFSGQHALARAADDWYAYDGRYWQPMSLPDDMQVVAVDLSAEGRIAVLGVVQPFECGRAQVVAVRTDEGWAYVRVDDDTPPAVGWELLDARIRVTDTSIEIERAERLWLDRQCSSPSEYEPQTDAAAQLIADLEMLDEVRRDSRHYAPINGGLAERWPGVARRGAHVAAAEGGGLHWTAPSPPRYTVPAMELTPSRPVGGDAATVALHETTIMNVATAVHVSGGIAMLKHGEQTWEVCPIADEELEQVNGEIGRAGEHLAVVVGKPEQTLFVVERTK